MTATLTARQHEILRFIAEGEADGEPRSVREIGAEFGIGSTNGVNDHLRALVLKDAILWQPLKSRSFRLTDAGWRALGAVPCVCGRWRLPAVARAVSA